MPELDTVDPLKLPDHAATHEAGGADEMSVAGLSGLLTTPQTPAAHVHIIADVTGLQTALDGKAATVHTHDHGGLDGLADDDHPQYLRVDGTRALTGDLSAGGNKITNLGTPSAAGDAAPKSYVDNAIAGLSWKASVRAASDGPVTLATDVEDGDTLDGVTLATGDRILLKDQAAGAENGIYVVAASGAPARADDANTAAELLGAAVYVREGTEHADTQWILTTDAPITLGTTGLTWTQLTTGGGGALADLSDVDLTGQADDDFLQRVSGVWVRRTIAQVRAALGIDSPIDAAALAAVGSGDLFAGTSLDGGWSSLQSTPLTAVDRSIARYVLLKNTGNTGGAERGIKRAFAPAGDWTVYAKLHSVQPFLNFTWSGLFAGAADPSDAASAKRVEVFLLSNSGQSIKMAKWASGAETSVFSVAIGSLAALAASPQRLGALWLRLRSSGTTVYADVSWDGVDWLEVGSTTIDFTVATCGLLAAQSSATNGIKATWRYIATTG